MENSEKDTYSYKGWLISDEIWKRAIAIWTYSLVTGIFIWAIIFFVALFLSIIFSLY